MGDPTTTPGSDTYYTRGDQSQSQHLEGLPLGTVGGLGVRHTFPLDAEYEFQVALTRTNLEAIRGLEHQHQLEITVDGERVFLGPVGGDAEAGQTGADHRAVRRHRRPAARCACRSRPVRGWWRRPSSARSPRTPTACGRSCAATPAPTTPPAGRT